MPSQTQSIIHVRRRWGRRIRGVGAARTAVIALATTALFATSALVAPTARAAVPPISGVRIEYARANMFMVRLNSLGSGWRYRIYASTVRKQIYYEVLSKAPHKSAYASVPRIGIGKIPYTTKLVYYRVQAEKGKARRTSGIFVVGLKPTMPTGVRATLVGGAVSVTWGGGAAGGAQVQQSTNASYTAGVKTYRMRGTSRQFTAFKLPAGTPHYFRVRSLNGNTPSTFTAPVRATPTSRSQYLRAMTYNILTLSSDRKKAAGGTISPWSQRRAAAARYVKRVMPDLIGVQEGASWTGPVRGERQVDDLRQALGTGTYGLARTEIPPNEPGYFRVSSYILYKKSTYTPVGTGGHWDIGKMPEGGSRFGAYQLFKHRTTGARVFYVSTHLYTPGGLAADKIRQKMTETLIAKATAVANGVPVVYAGDFNSHEMHALDGPAVAMNKAKATDGFWVAPVLGFAKYNSANQYYRTPPASADNIDHIYASAGVGVRGWSQVLLLSGSKFSGVIPSDHNPVMADLSLPY